MTVAAINRFIRLLSDSFQALGVQAPAAEVERLAMRVHATMDQPGRTYHTSAHLFPLCEGMNPRQVLAALFHDLVYIQLDGGLPPLAEHLFRDVVRQDVAPMQLRAGVPADRDIALCIDLFGFQPGQTLPLYGGMNEFLSAVVAVRWLKPYLEPVDLLAVVACIEATIPFRGPDAAGHWPSEVLHRRLMSFARDSGLPLSEADGLAMVREAIALANRDVGSFAEADPGDFLSTTWMLIDESNAPLKVAGVYTVGEYRQALMRMGTFLGGLDPARVFRQYAGWPGDGEFDAMRRAAGRNLVFADDYLGAKIAVIGLIEALALATGGDGPVSMFLGDLQSPFGRPDRLEDFLPEVPVHPDCDPHLLRVLGQGRNIQSRNDMTVSPLTSYVYRYLGRTGMQGLLADVHGFFKGERSAADFLLQQDRQLVHAIAHACAGMALSRSDALLKFCA